MSDVSYRQSSTPVGVACRAESLRCMVGVVVCNPQALKSHFLPFLGQEGTKLEIHATIRLHI